MITIRHNIDPGQFRTLWARYINGGNIKYHCNFCLKGVYSKKFSIHNKELLSTPLIVMDEVPIEKYDAIYFCGIAKASVREKTLRHNLHFVIRPAEGETDVWEFEQWRVEIENGRLEYIPLTGELRPQFFEPPYDEHYYTCRNFLWMVSRYYPEALNPDKLLITCVRDSDGIYDTDNRIPISPDEWRSILSDLTENDVESWNLLREFHRAKEHSAYARDVAKTLGISQPELMQRIERLGLKVAARQGTFRIVHHLDNRSECWWPVFFSHQNTAGNDPILTLRHDVAAIMDEIQNTQP